MKIPKSLDKFDLESPKDYMDERYIVLTEEAETGCGKSDMVVRSAPEPILVIDLDRNIKGMIKKYAERDILVKSINMPKYDKKRKGDEQQKRDMDLLSEIYELYMESLESGVFQTIFVDTFDALYELARRGILGGGLDFGDAKRTDFAPVNAFMKSFFDEAKCRPVNFIASLHMKDEYKGANSTGNRTRAGWKGTIQCSQCHVRLYKSDDKGLNKFNLNVVKSTLNTNIEGLRLQGEDISFGNLQRAIFDGIFDDMVADEE